MSALVLDAGALVAVDRGDRGLVGRLRTAQRSGLELRTTGAVLAEVWRDPHGRQANLARLLKALDVTPVDRRLGQAAGELLGASGKRNAVDATVVAIAATGDRILTSDPRDIRELVDAARRGIDVVSC